MTLNRLGAVFLYPMSTTLISYADEKFKPAQQFLNQTAKITGLVDSFVGYGPKDIDANFRSQNEYILSNPRGGGYWLWKPYVILKTLESANWGDFIFYSDSASYFIEPATRLTNLTYLYDQDIISFELQQLESDWTKRDAFFYMQLDSENFQMQPQRLASHIIFKKTPFVMQFAQEYLKYCCDSRIITDDPNECGLPNYEKFIGNRHDQSVFSLLCKKYQIIPFRDPSQWGIPHMNNYTNSNYPQILYLTRQPTPKEASVKYIWKARFIKIINYFYAKIIMLSKRSNRI